MEKHRRVQVNLNMVREIKVTGVVKYVQIKGQLAVIMYYGKNNKQTNKQKIQKNTHSKDPNIKMVQKNAIYQDKNTIC